MHKLSRNVNLEKLPTFQYEHNRNQYKGQYWKNIKHGFGIEISENSEIYEGEWAFDKENVYGRKVYLDGSVYTGFWKDSYHNGLGEFHIGQLLQFGKPQSKFIYI